MLDCASPLVATDAATSSKSSPARKAAGSDRGPFRPEVWLNTRKRSNLRLASYYFRAIDVIAVAGVALSVLASRSGLNPQLLTLAEVLPLVAGVSASLSLLRTFELYRFGPDRSAVAHVACVAAAGGLGLAAAITLGLILGGKGLNILPAWGAAATATLLGLHSLWLILVARWRRQGALTPNVVIVGATPDAESLIAGALKRRDLNVLGVFDDRLARSPARLAGVPLLGGADALLKHRILPYVDRIVLAIDADAGPRVRELTRRLEALPNPVTVLLGSDAGRDTVMSRLAGAPLAPLEGRASADRRAFVKRLQDLSIGALALIAAAPVMALIALAIRLDSPGPIFFRQRRHGFNQEAIVVWKFRSMRHEAADATASRQITADDDRVTRVGRFIRATSLDELPQIFNVLTGEMSLVGPRPHAIGMKTGDKESALLVSEYAHRHRIKPGMTGWAAVKGSRGPVPTEVDVRRRVELDIDYIQRQSFWLDLWILLITVPVLLGDRAAVR